MATAVWAGALLCGSIGLSAYATRPCDRGAPRAAWPTELLGERGDELRLLVFAHPRCPCTRSTLWEAAELLAAGQGAMRADVYFFAPLEEGEDWARTDLWSIAESTAGMRPHTDFDGRLAEELGALTSGHAQLYDRAGRLRFDGGLTPTRGHQGNFHGTDAIEALLREGDGPMTVTQVFGCGIQDTCLLPDD